MSEQDRADELIQQMKEAVYQANLALPRAGLVKLTWGNVSQINRELGVIVIKPSGIPYQTMKAKDMVVTNLDGEVLSGELRPSSDLPTHSYLYQEFSEVNSIVHTHSKWAVCWAQAGRDIPAYGTTHADTFYGSVPCTRKLTQEEVATAYELETGKVIVETFAERKLDPLAIPAVVVNGHGPFTWGGTPEKAVEASLILEEVAEMALHSEELAVTTDFLLPSYVLNKHYFRKHGAGAYYGQGN
ncbi:L-ribulose-5-phosphate 4-epimerase [Carnobacterium gallinarum]|uniref:L-ribulose-5-phosphate 4-epimerase n=1 Tax=Carnobacterium gallinarum TaxID=2749 RepID=UPI00055643BA|nr:L-ribulose-5-phosphate 4-epimerase [Carnobacterium gallinarum]